jgi:hypothetical protein
MRSRRKAGPDTLSGVVSAGHGLTEALSVVCDEQLPEQTRLAAVKESWLYLKRLSHSMVAVEMQDARGGPVELKRKTLPSQAIEFIELRSKHVLSWEELKRLPDKKRVRTLEQLRSPLGSAVIMLPIREALAPSPSRGRGGAKEEGAQERSGEA